MIPALYFAVTLPLILLLEIVCILLGFIFVPIGILTAKDRGPKLELDNGDWWRLRRMPTLLKIWDNPEDGLLGGWPWWHRRRLREGDDQGCHSFWSQFKWSAVRNPANGIRTLPKPFALQPADIEKMTIGHYGSYQNPSVTDGENRWHFSWATNGWFYWPHVWGVFRVWGNTFVRVRAGWKVLPQDKDKEIKGSRSYGIAPTVQLIFRKSQ